MATRILILTSTGQPIFGLDGHHGAEHAARWIDDTIAQLTAQGIADAVAVEIIPEQGGDDCRRGIIGALHELRLETRRTPTGAREIIALNRVTQPEGEGDERRAAAATPQRVRASLRLVHAPPEYTGPRHPIRIGRGRLDPTPGTPASPQAARLQRRLDAANKRLAL